MAKAKIAASKLEKPTLGRGDTLNLDDPNIMAWGRLRVVIVGRSPYLFSNQEDAAEQIETQREKERAPKTPKVNLTPEQRFLNSLIVCNEQEVGRPKSLKDARSGRFVFGVNAQAVLNMIVETALSVGMFKTEVNRAISVLPKSDGKIPFKATSRVFNKRHFVIHKKVVADLAYRGCVDEWSLSFDVDFNPHLLSAVQIASLIKNGGRCNGLGAFRHQKRGTYGYFDLESVTILEAGRA